MVKNINVRPPAPLRYDGTIFVKFVSLLQSPAIAGHLNDHLPDRIWRGKNNPNTHAAYAGICTYVRF